MLYKIKHITEAIHLSREQKGLSQRALSHKVGLPQSHISNIENGSVDLKTSSLVELARALDLELMLVPRAMVNTVKGLTTRMDDRKDEKQAPPAYWFNEDQDDG